MKPVRGSRLRFAAIGLLALVAFAQTRPAIELERAITKEEVDGDLKAAVAAYQNIATDKSARRPRSRPR